MRWQKFSAIFAATLTIILACLTLASTAWAVEYKVLYEFKGGQDGASPSAGLIFDAAGNLYGTTENGGDLTCQAPNGYSCGTVFKLTPNPDGSWSESVLHNFLGYPTDGELPHSELVLDATGNLYGTAWEGGTDFFGTIFKLTSNPDGSWAETVLHSFHGTPDGAHPSAGLIFDAAGNLYGTTENSGAHRQGAIFKVTPNPDESWSESVIYSLVDGDGRDPHGGLIFDAAGNLYGTTVGNRGRGTVFKLSPKPDGDWTMTKLHTFKGPDGAHPFAGLIFDAAGNLYGTTAYGGTYDGGTVFKLTPQPDREWKLSKLHTFQGPDGAHPYAGLMFDAADNLYGTTANGGPYDGGTVFKLRPQPDGHWKFTKLHAFKNHHPFAGLVMDAAGNLYGTTTSGGKGYGVVFKIKP